MEEGGGSECGFIQKKDYFSASLSGVQWHLWYVHFFFNIVDKKE
jgi:hypothetical protein